MNLSDINESTLQMIINGGLVSVALASLMLVYKLISNHMAHDMASRKEENESRQKHTEALQGLIDAIANIKDLLLRK